MPRYFFHIAAGDHVVKDDRGVDLSGLRAAHWHALELLLKMQAHLPPEDREEDGVWLIEVSDETGAAPLIVLPASVRW
jgi:hypothetical protein